MSSGMAYTLQILGQRDLNPAIASLIMCLESVFSALGGWMLLHQNLSAREVFGCVLIFAAVVLAQLPLEMLHRVKKDYLTSWRAESRRHSCARQAASNTS